MQTPSPYVSVVSDPAKGISNAGNRQQHSLRSPSISTAITKTSAKRGPLYQPPYPIRGSPMFSSIRLPADDDTKSLPAWRKDSDWKARYSKLYSSRRISMPQEEQPHRISFMSNEPTPNQSFMMRSHRSSLASGSCIGLPYNNISTTILSHRSNPYSSNTGTLQSDDLGGHETMLLDMVRARSKDLEAEAQDKTLDLPKDEESDEYEPLETMKSFESSEACVHGLSMRYTERSVSRSRFSRISTKRDMDIPSILAFTINTPAPIQLEIPGFQKVTTPQNEEIPRWSIRRSICPVCSQKWKDRSAITNVKYSGLKRNSSSELPTVIAPARLRASITMAYVPRPTLAVVDEDAPGYRLLRNTSATWQLTRARRFRIPRQQPPPPEATAPPSASAPLARKDLDIRVHKFLNDEK